MLMQTQLRAISVNQPRANTIPRLAPVPGGFAAMEAMGGQMKFGSNEPRQAIAGRNWGRHGCFDRLTR
jgi:hypothetical protein